MKLNNIITTIDKIYNLQYNYVINWHNIATYNVTINDELLDLVIKQHSFNFQLWHQEDIARKKNVSDSIIASVKRKIDELNQNRNEHIEKIDSYLVKKLIDLKVEFKKIDEFNSETPGQIIDKMSIMSLKIYHMKEQIERTEVDSTHISSCQNKLDILRIQRNDLFEALKSLISNTLKGVRTFKIYKQFKMYNDPELNPELYKE